MGGFKSVISNMLNWQPSGSPAWSAQQSAKIAQQHQDLEKQQELRLQHEADLQFHEHMMKLRALPIINGLVQEEVPLPSGGTTTIHRKPEGQQVPYTDAAGTKFGYELPSVKQQLFMADMERRAAAQGEAYGATTGAAAGHVATAVPVAQASAEAAATQRQTALETRGLPVPDDVADTIGYPRGTKVLPEELIGAKEAADKIRSGNRLVVPQGASVADFTPATAAPPASAPPTPTAPAASPTGPAAAIPGGGRIVAGSTMNNLTPADWKAAVDGVIPDKNNPLYARTLSQVNFFAKAGRPDLAQQRLDEASKQLGSTETAVRTAREEMPGKIAMAEAMARATMAGQSALLPAGEAMAKAIADYKQAPLTGFALRAPQGQAIMARAQDYNPDYHAEYYNNFQKTENDATTGKIGTSANALNTMMGHLSVLNNAADALKNGNIQALNRIGNFVGVQAGQNPVTTYETIVHRLGPEVTKAYLAAGGSVGERGTNEEDFSSKLSPDQIKSNIGVSAYLANSKIEALNHQYQQGTYGRGKQQLISPEADAARQALISLAPKGATGGKAGDFPVSVPNGKTYHFKSQQDADAFKASAGIK